MAEVLPNRTDQLLSVVEATPREQLSWGFLIDTLKDQEGFESFTKKAIIESMAHLDTNERIAFDPTLRVTQRGLQRLVEVGLR